jgi:hypothetical protein
MQRSAKSFKGVFKTIVEEVYLLILLSNQRTKTITATTTKTPIHIPALKTSPNTSHPANVVVTIIKNRVIKGFFITCF